MITSSFLQVSLRFGALPLLVDALLNIRLSKCNRVTTRLQLVNSHPETKPRLAPPKRKRFVTPSTTLPSLVNKAYDYKLFFPGFVSLSPLVDALFNKRLLLEKYAETKTVCHSVHKTVPQWIIAIFFCCLHVLCFGALPLLADALLNMMLVPEKSVEMQQGNNPATAGKFSSWIKTVTRSPENKNSSPFLPQNCPATNHRHFLPLTTCRRSSKRLSPVFPFVRMA